MTQPFICTGDFEKLQRWYETTPQRIQEACPETQIFGIHPLDSGHLKGPALSTMKRSPLASGTPWASFPEASTQARALHKVVIDGNCERDQQPVLPVTPPDFKGLLPVPATSGSFPFVSLCAGPLLHYCQWACKSLLRLTCESQTPVPWKLNSLTCSHFSLWCQPE